MKTGLLFLFLSVWGLSLCEAQSRKSIDTSTDILALLNPIAGFTGSLIIKDYKGTKQVVLGGLTNLAANYILEYSIRKNVPTGAATTLFLPPIHRCLSRVPLFCKDAMAGNSAPRLMQFPLTWDGDGSMPGNTTFGMCSPELL